jgi:ABC-type nitrate/sulfonate/bicarbonate transport system ATPase subunit
LTVIASHDIPLVLSLADRIIVLGGPPLRVVRDSRVPVTGWSDETADELAALIAETRGPA